MEEPTKVCSKCKEEKLVSYFNVSLTRNYKIQHFCKDCSSIAWKEYYLKNKDKLRIKHREYKKRKYNKDIIYTLREKLRSRLYTALKKNYKSGSAVRDLGCSIEYLKIYLESKFAEGMSWDNQGKWQIDHIRPLASFDLSIKEEFLKAVHYSNLQPLWGIDNRKKSDKYGTAR